MRSNSQLLSDSLLRSRKVNQRSGVLFRLMTATRMRVAVISLKRTPERWFTFLERNKLSLSNCELLRIDGIDGREILNSNIHTNMVTTSARQKWSAGAIGIGLSHM